MPDTVNLLETALENEAKLILELISKLENDDIYEFAKRISDLTPRGDTASDEILHVAQNIKDIANALENIYVA